MRGIASSPNPKNIQRLLITVLVLSRRVVCQLMMTTVETCEKRDFAIDERNKYDIVNRMCGRREVGNSVQKEYLSAVWFRHDALDERYFQNRGNRKV